MSPMRPMDDLRAVPSAWPALVALAIVVALALGLIAFDLSGGVQTYERTNYMVDNSVGSLVIVSDLRYQAARLLAVRDPAQAPPIVAQIDADLGQYQPLATEVGEREEYTRLAGALADVRRTGPSAEQLASICASIDHLEDINVRAAYRNAEQIRATHEREIAADVVVGVVTLLLAIAIGLVLVRALRRQRALLEVHLGTLAERRRELEAFASRVAHDLRGPLSPLRGYSDLLSDESSPEVREIALRVRRAADRMGGIIDELLALSVHGTLLAGQGRVAEVAREILDELSPELADADVTLAVGDARVACSPGVLGQVLRNLLSNAVKYRASERRLVVRIECEHDDARGLVVITIGDNGIGMDQHAVAHAFEPLYRAPGASRSGHGLGLSIVKRTVETAGGTVELTSLPHAGTRVIVRIPSA
ncbi:MAG TPA: HAMP domain-containing sensor histidine kinase [Kofleriaceae bacterium]|nr:HAMP domain-containing sensor histidine kinase [Kofleriaceae bacterium]